MATSRTMVGARKAPAIVHRRNARPAAGRTGPSSASGLAAAPMHDAVDLLLSGRQRLLRTGLVGQGGVELGLHDLRDLRVDGADRARLDHVEDRLLLPV